MLETPGTLHLWNWHRVNDALSFSVTNLRPKDTEETPFWYTFKVQCTSCRETHAKEVAVSRFVSSWYSSSPPHPSSNTGLLGYQRNERESWGGQLRLEVQELQGLRIH